MLFESNQGPSRRQGPWTDAKACEASTRGLLQRAHIVANWPSIYIGKESDKHWEAGEDLSLFVFKTVEYKRRGYAVATNEQLDKIAKLPKREFGRRGINQHALEKICSKMPVRTTKLVQCLKVQRQTNHKIADRDVEFESSMGPAPPFQAGYRRHQARLLQSTEWRA